MDWYNMDPEQLKKQRKEEMDMVVKDWAGYFTELKRFRSGKKLLKRMGPFLVGVGFSTYSIYSDDYEALFTWYNLMDNLPPALPPIRIQQLEIKRGKATDFLHIRYSQHLREYLEVCHIVEKQGMISLWGKVSLKDIVTRYLANTEEVLKLQNSFWRCYGLIQLSYLLDDKHLQEKYRKKGLVFINRMGKDAINYFTNGDDTWYTQLESMNRDKLLEIIEANVKKYKVTNWPDYCIW